MDLQVGDQWISFLIVPVPHAGYVNIYGQEATERIRMEQRLAEQAELFETVQDAIIATDAQLIITSWNKAAEELYAWAQAEALGKHANQLLRSELTSSERETILREIRQAGVAISEVIHHTRDGRRIVIESHTRGRLISSGEVVGYISANRDISQRIEFEAEREHLLQENRRQAALLDSIFEADPSGLAVVAGPELRLVYANPIKQYPVTGYLFRGDRMSIPVNSFYSAP